jgi:UDPglucose 6-dehydrogenase
VNGFGANSQKTLIIGGGVVGAATAKALVHIGAPVSVLEISNTRAAELASDGLDVLTELPLGKSFDLAIVCLPTPSVESGYDLEILLDGCREVAKAVEAGTFRLGILAVRSTVPPGTAEQRVEPLFAQTSTQVASFPECLRQEHASKDSLNPRVQVVGSRSAGVRLHIRAMFEPLGGTWAEFDTAAGAELAKCAYNAYNAAKISFFNELARIGDAHGIDSAAVAKTVTATAEASWNPDYGTKTGAAFGGHCLPKDLTGLIAHGESLGLDLPVLRATREINESFG